MPHHECSSIAEGANCGRDQLHMASRGPEPREPRAQCEPRRYLHITYRRQRRGKQAGWIVQYDGRTWGGYHATQHDAAKTLQKAMNLPRLSLVPRLMQRRIYKRPASHKSMVTSVRKNSRRAPHATLTLMKKWPVPQMHRAGLRSRRPYSSGSSS